MDSESGESRNPSVIKGRCNWAHAAKRASERYNIPGRLFADAGNAVKAYVACEIPLFDVVQLANDYPIKSRSLFAVYIDRLWCAVVYDHPTKTPVTMLPPDRLDPWRNVLEKRTPASSTSQEPQVSSTGLLRAVYEAAKSEVGIGYTRKMPLLTAALNAVKRFFEGDSVLA